MKFTKRYESIRHLHESLVMTKLTKPIVLVCGANYSGTSMVTKLLLDNGGWGGEFDTGYAKQTPYLKYENKELHKFARAKLRLSRDGYPTEKFVKYLNSLPDEVVILKYPKATFIADWVFQNCDREVRMVYVLRSPRSVVRSAVAKNNTAVGDELLFYAESMEQSAKFKGEVFYVMYERTLLRRGLEPLLAFCNLPLTTMDAIKPEMENYGYSRS